MEYLWTSVICELGAYLSRPVLSVAVSSRARSYRGYRTKPQPQAIWERVYVKGSEKEPKKDLKEELLRDVAN